MALNTRQQRQIDYYNQQFQEYGTAHYLFACHAAFPVVFSVDMLHQLWANFNNINAIKIPKVVISDFLLSNLCQEVGLGLYEFRDKAIRTALLHDLEQQFDKQHRNRLAAFLYQYAKKHYNTPEYQNLKDTHQWTALATLNPQEAIQKIGDAISKSVVENNAAEKMRIHSLLEEMVEVQPVLSEVLDVVGEVLEETGGKEFIPYISEKSNDKFLLEIKISRKRVENIEGSDLIAEQRINEVIKNKNTELDLSELGIYNIPNMIIEAKQLKKIDISGNKINSINILFGLNYLEELRLNDNFIKEIPKEISNLSQLKKLDISNNRLIEIPKEIKFLNLLEYLNLNNNLLTNLPIEVYLLVNMRYLNLSKNDIQKIPVEILRLYKLRYLNIKSTKINYPNSLNKRTYLYLDKDEKQNFYPLKK